MALSRLSAGFDNERKSPIGKFLPAGNKRKSDKKIFARKKKTKTKTPCTEEGDIIKTMLGSQVFGYLWAPMIKVL